MAGWSGFTEEDLLRLKRDSEANTGDKQKIHNSEQRRISTHKAKAGDEKSIRSQQQNRRKMPLKQEKVELGKFETLISGKIRISSDKVLSTKEIDKIGITYDRDISKGNETLKNKEEESEVSSRCSLDLQIPIEATVTSSTSSFDGMKREEPDLKPIADEEVAELELNNLINLQKRQKEIEEENKKKKQIINNTITQRYRKAQHEASTLQNVQRELVALDCLLAKDVEILRTKIEEATLAFSIAQRRYDKAEKEFVNAKLDLKLKSDVKEELTQHLYTIIQENELRKSRKLEELMSKLNVGENVTDVKSNADHAIDKVRL